MRGVVGEGGGGYHAIMGTLIITALAALMSIPVGLLTAIYLVEYGKGRLARAITFFVDVMTGIPSIVAGLFAFALFALFFGPGVRMGFAGAVALSVLMIPVVVRATEEMLKIVPNELREAAYALGTPKWRTIIKVVIPTSIAGIASGITLAIARVIGETAPLLIIAGLTTALNFNPFDGRMATLPVFAYTSYAAPGVPREPYLDRAWAAALVLIIIVLALNLLARLIARAVRAQDPIADPREESPWPRPSTPRPEHLLRLVPRGRGREHGHQAEDGHRADRAVRLRQVHLPALDQPDARGDPGRPRRGHARAGRQEPLRPRRRPGGRAPPDRHGLPAAQPVPHDVDLRQRDRRACG